MSKWCAKWKIFLDFVLKRFKMAWSVSDLIWSVSKCFEAFRNVLKRFKMSWSVSNSIWSVSKCLEAFRIRFEAFWNVLKPFEFDLKRFGGTNGILKFPQTHPPISPFQNGWWPDDFRGVQWSGCWWAWPRWLSWWNGKPWPKGADDG